MRVANSNFEEYKVDQEVCMRYDNKNCIQNG